MKKKTIAAAILVVIIIITAAAVYTYFHGEIAGSELECDIAIFVVIAKFAAAVWGLALIALEIIIYQAISYYYLDNEIYHNSCHKFIIALIVLAVITVVSLPFVWLLAIVEFIILAVETGCLISWIRHRKKDSALTLQNNPQ